VKDEKDHIDDFFKERSEQGSFEAPDSFLDDINSKLDALDQKKKRRGGFFWWSLIPLGLIVIYALWPNDSQNKKTQLLTENKAEKSSNEKEINDSTQLKKSLTIRFEDSLSLNKVKENASSSKNTLSSGIESKTKISPLKEGDEVSNAIVEQDNSLLIKEELKKQEQPNSSNSNNESEIVPPEIKESVIADSNPEKNIESINSNINTTQNEEIELSETNAVKDNNKNEDAVIIDTLDTNLSENSTIHSDTSESASVQIDSLSTDKEDQDSTLNVEEVDPSETMLAGGNRKKDDKIDHEIQLYGGMLNSSSNLILSNDSSTFPMNTMESNLWSSSFGVMYRAKIKQFDLGAGLSWKQNGEKVNYSTSITQYTDVDSLIFVTWQIDSIYNQNSQTWTVDSIPLFDTTTTTESITDSIFYNDINKYTWISIPLRFGYRFDINKFSIIPRVGIDLSFVSSSNLGTYVEQYNQGLVQKSPSQFVLSYALQLEVRRNFERWHVFVNPYFRSNVTPVISSVIQTRRYNSWGINAGIGLKLK